MKVWTPAVGGLNKHETNKPNQKKKKNTLYKGCLVTLVYRGNPRR